MRNRLKEIWTNRNSAYCENVEPEGSFPKSSTGETDSLEKMISSNRRFMKSGGLPEIVDSVFKEYADFAKDNCIQYDYHSWVSDKNLSLVGNEKAYATVVEMIAEAFDNVGIFGRVSVELEGARTSIAFRVSSYKQENDGSHSLSFRRDTYFHEGGTSRGKESVKVTEQVKKQVMAKTKREAESRSIDNKGEGVALRYADVRKIRMDSEDRLFLLRLDQKIDELMNSDNLTVKNVAKEMGMSHSVLFKKCKKLVKVPVSKYIQVRKIKKAADLLREENLSVKATMKRVGFSDPKHFRECFRDEIGELPSKWRTYTER
ncbi:helix-turn-helix domain-containing protein [Fulvitalea axinellae]